MSRTLTARLCLAGLAPFLGILACAPSQEAPALLPEPARTPFVELKRVGPDSGLRGEMVEARQGDWVLRNENLAVVIRSLTHRSGFARSGGNIIDVAPHGSNDVLREVFTYFDDRFPRQAVYDILGPAASPDSGTVTLIARGRDSENPRIGVVTRYTLALGAHHLELATTLTNHGTVPVNEFEVGDAIEWGRTLFFAPGPGHRLIGTREEVPFLLGYGEGTSYAWFQLDGNLRGPHGSIWSDPIVDTFDLEPGGSATYVRRLLVGRGSPSNLAREALAARGDTLDLLRVDVGGDDGTPIGGARILARDGQSRTLAWGETGSDGMVELPLPPGIYSVEAVHPERGTHTLSRVTMEAPVEVPVTTVVRIELPEPGRVSLRARDEDGRDSPARWTFVGLEESNDPVLGPGHRIEGAGNTVFTAEGRGDVFLPPGDYKVLATRGPAYESWEAEVSLDPGKEISLSAELQLLVPEDWAAADFHVHSLPSYDATVSLEDRARSLVCEGLSWFTASDHGWRTEFGPLLDTLDLAAPLHALVGEEITTSDLGHFNAFPLPVEAGSHGYGALDPWQLDLDGIFDTLRDRYPDAVIQVNHPRAGRLGYLDQHEFVRPDSMAEGTRLDFDLMEIVNGKNLPSFPQVWKDWVRLLRSGRRVVGVGNSDSHQLTGSEVGYPRNYVRVQGGGEADFLSALRRGSVVVSNGPFIEFTIDDAGVGDTLLVPAGTHTAHIRVVAPSWVDVRRVMLYVNGEERSVFMVEGRERSLRFDESVEFRVDYPGFVMVVVEGDESLSPVIPASIDGAESRPVTPLAFTNPIWLRLLSSRR